MALPIYSGYPTPPNAPEPLEYGNINLLVRKAVKIDKSTGKISSSSRSFDWATVRTTTVGPITVERFQQQVMVNLPTISSDGTKILTDAQALQQFRKDGLHLGIFSTTKNSDGTYLAAVYAKKLSENESVRISRDQSVSQNPTDSANYSIDGITAKTADFITDVFAITGLERSYQNSISERLTGLSVSYSMNMSTELSATFYDDNYKLTESGYFDLRRQYTYRGRLFEVGASETGPGPGGSPQVSVQFWPLAIQELKRDKKPEAIAGANGFEYARRIASLKGLTFVGENSQKQQSIFKARSSSTDESVWDVLTGAAGENQYSVFEVDGVLVYGSMQWMLWRFGLSTKVNAQGKRQMFLDLRYDPTQPNNGAKSQEVVKTDFLDIGADGTREVEVTTRTVQDNGVFELTSWPRVRMSENDGLEGTGSCSVMSPNGKLLRPGHTVYLTTVPEHFRGGYLVTDVAFNEFDPSQAEISFVTPQKPKDQNKPTTE